MVKEMYVVMGNDFPAGIFDKEELADAYVERQKARDTDKRPGRRIYWRVYSFDLNAGESE